MKTKGMVQKSLWNILLGGIGFLSSAINIMGYNPVIPAYFAANCLAGEHSLILYLGVLVGMGWFQPLSMTVKYVFVLVLIEVAIRFYVWANRKCPSTMAGVIAGISCVAMNLSGNAISVADRTELIGGISEGILVFGLTILFYFVLHMLHEIFVMLYPKNEEKLLLVEEPSYSGKEARIDAFATAVDGLSAAFASMDRMKMQSEQEDTRILEQEITGRLCAACDSCAICWNEGAANRKQALHRMLHAVVAHQPREEIAKMQYMESCPKYPRMVEEAVLAFSRMELNQAWYRRLLENRMIIAGQLDAMADLMEDWSRGEKNIDTKSRLILARMAYEVKERGIVAENMHIYEDVNHRCYIRAIVSTKWGGGIPARNYVQALETAMRKNLRLEQNAKSVLTQEKVQLTVYEDTFFYVMTGIALQKKNGSSISGDNYAMFTLEDGRYFACLSDGMGSGSRASRESELVVDLMQKFMEAGFTREAAIKMMNSAMVLQGADNTYSTLDVAQIDLYTGELLLDKIGTAASFIKHGSEVECISSNTLPAGVHVQPPLDSTSRMLHNGDFLVLVTDGVLEYLHVKKPEEKFGELLSDIETDNASVLSNTLMERVMLFTGGYAMDDMSILVVGIWEK